MMNFNEEIKLGSELLDVSGMARQQRILYFPKRKVVVLKSNSTQAKIDNLTMYGGKAVIISPHAASRQFPEVFCNSAKSDVKLSKRTIILKVEPELYDFCVRQEGNISSYLRHLIQREMTNPKKRL